MSNGTEPVPDDLKELLEVTGINPDRVTEWVPIGDAYAIRMQSATGSVTLTIIERSLD
jgi:hypothetical protein